MPEQANNFSNFYAFYLSEHSNKTCRQLHFAGSTLVLLCVLGFIRTGDAYYLLAAPVCGYGFAWLGHFVFEKNKPASFKRPLFSFLGDWVMFWQLLTRQIPFDPKKA